MDFPAILTLNFKIAVSLVNKLTPGASGGAPMEVPEDPEQRRAAALAAFPVEGEWREVDSLDLETSEALYTLAGRLRPLFEAESVDTAAELVNQLLDTYAARPVLVHDEDGPWRLHFHSPLVGVAAARGAGAGTAMAVLLDMGQFDRIGVCEARNCDRVYFDTTRNSRKRFCSVACNNRTKMAMFRQRQSAAAA
jgi:predicted RNA-binding Zn ribbon-like protein